jgi:uncharacterized protein YktA (UPF0223 family)
VLLELFNSKASNYLVSVAVSVNKIEKRISKEIDASSLVELYSSIKNATELIESKIKEIELKQLNKVMNNDGQ